MELLLFSKTKQTETAFRFPGNMSKRIIWYRSPQMADRGRTLTGPQTRHLFAEIFIGDP